MKPFSRTAKKPAQKRKSPVKRKVSYLNYGEDKDYEFHLWPGFGYELKKFTVRSKRDVGEAVEELVENLAEDEGLRSVFLKDQDEIDELRRGGWDENEIEDQYMYVDPGWYLYSMNMQIKEKPAQKRDLDYCTASKKPAGKQTLKGKKAPVKKKTAAGKTVKKTQAKPAGRKR